MGAAVGDGVCVGSGVCVGDGETLGGTVRVGACVAVGDAVGVLVGEAVGVAVRVAVGDGVTVEEALGSSTAAWPAVRTRSPGDLAASKRIATIAATNAIPRQPADVSEGDLSIHAHHGQYTHAGDYSWQEVPVKGILPGPTGHLRLRPPAPRYRSVPATNSGSLGPAPASFPGAARNCRGNGTWPVSLRP